MGIILSYFTGILAFTILIICQVLIINSSIAKEAGFTNYDGDTFRATFRIIDIDTPEIKGKCQYEKDLAQRAKVFTKKFLQRKSIVIRTFGKDKYGRVLAKVTSHQNNLADALISAGLARPWKGKRETWC
tara:strand:- start:139 stop:528 length:390 start_codon:yes stop_codon:yes gene_type:complete